MSWGNIKKWDIQQGKREFWEIVKGHEVTNLPVDE